MKNTDLRAKARAIFGSAVAEPMPNQPNGAKALQQRANARPIPTYKVGGPVKKTPMPGDSVASGNRMSKMEADERRFMDMMDKKKKMPSARDAVDSGNRVNKLEGAEMRKMQMAKGGKAGRYADGGSAEDIEQVVTANRIADKYNAQNINYNMPPTGSNSNNDSMGGGSGGVPYVTVAPRPTVKRPPPLGIRSTAGYTGATADLDDGQLTFGVGKNRRIGFGYGRQFKKGGKVQTSADTAEKLATEMGGMKKGGKAPPKSGLAVMIAIGKPMKPNKKMNGGPMASRSMDMESSKLTREMAGGGNPMGYAAGGAGKTRKGQAPIKKAQGGGIGGSQHLSPSQAAQAHRDLGQQLKAQIAAGKITNAQANVMLREQSPALQQTRAIQAKQAAARGDFIGGPPAPKVAQLPEQVLPEYRGKQQQGSSGRNLLGALRPGVTPPIGNAKGGRITKPTKKAQGGAAKVRKGMMTPEGNITHAMNKIRG
jgi:hypothetical protein